MKLGAKDSLLQALQSLMFSNQSLLGLIKVCEVLH